MRWKRYPYHIFEKKEREIVIAMLVVTDEVRGNFSVGKSAGGASADEILTVGRVVNFDDRFEVIVVAGVNHGVAEDDDGRNGDVFR